MKMKPFLLRIALLLSLGVAFNPGLFAQSGRQREYVTVQIIPDHSDWNYLVGENVTFEISVMVDNYRQQDASVNYGWGPDMLPAVTSGVMQTGNGSKTITLKGMDKPGFMTLNTSVTSEGRTYTNYLTVAFQPEKIAPQAKMPDDFAEFWDKTLADAAKVPLESVVTHVAERSTHFSDTYHVRLRNGNVSGFIYGVLSVPKGEGPFPAVIQYPGAGIRGYSGNPFYPQQGVVHFEIGIHGIPIDLPQSVYSDLSAGALNGYQTFNADDRDTYYLRGSTRDACALWISSPRSRMWTKTG
jgi:hypothetical protein